MSNLLGDKSVGSIVKIKENGTAANYIVVHKGKPSSLYDESCNGVWLLREKALDNRAWDGTSASYDNNYETSDIHAWLNNTFYNTIESKIRDAIIQVKIPFKKGVGSSSTPVYSGANGLSCKVFILSGYEVGFTTSQSSYLPVDGAKLSYFLNGNSDDTAKSKRIATNSTSNAVLWWLRSVGTNNAFNAWRVETNGTLHHIGHTYDVDTAPRPALVLPSSLLVDSSGNVSTNTPPTITCDKSGNVGTVADGITVNYSVNDADAADTLTVTEYLNNVQKRRYTATKGKQESANYTGTEWLKVSNGTHTIKISCTDGKETVEKTVTFTRTCTEATVTLITPLTADDKIAVCSLKIRGALPNDTILSCEVTNNANDTTPVWEDCTAKVKAESPYIFKNKTAANGFAFNFRISAKRGASNAGGYITGIEGGFFPDGFDCVGGVTINTDGEFLPCRGGNFADMGHAGPFALDIDNTRATANAGIGFRAAYYK